MSNYLSVMNEPAEPETEELVIRTEVPADLAGTVDLIERNDARTATVWFTKSAGAVLCTEAVTLTFGMDSYSGELTYNGVERYYEFAPGSPTEGAIGTAWAAANPAAAAIEACEWAERIEEEEKEAA
ncbi:hypothetical protein ACFSQT_14260 [Mesorhizobium calcicola]|uniref:Uncharacterized protein n=1 Tax=Mesorhizobium calcicola TaxID=1300310 RepID=A0ABW4WC42_9HYPH